MALLSGIYKLLLSGRRLIYSYIGKPQNLPAKVISVGNLTLGGTGKTPATIAIATKARIQGFKPCILTRGYRGSVKGPCFVTMGNQPLMCPFEAGDEAYLMAERLKGVTIVKGADRYRAGLLAIESLKSRITDHGSRIIFILDDGFQHWSLKRDVDIVLIDSTRLISKERLFPEGRLREPLYTLRRADIIVLTKTEQSEDNIISENINVIRRYNPSAPLYRASFRAEGLVDLSGRGYGLQKLKGKGIYAFAGIANPSHFKSMLTSLGADIVKFRVFRDHHAYKIKDIDEIDREAGGLDIITTEKDMVKIKAIKALDNLYALRIEFSVEEEFYNQLFRGIRDVKEH